MPNLSQVILSEIQRDLAAFSDPGSLVNISPSGIVQWERGRKTHNAQLIYKQGIFPDVLFGGRQLTYEGFLSSETLADLRDLALSIITLIPPIDEFIPAPAQTGALTEKPIDHEDAGELVVSCAILNGSMPFGSTRVLFLHGNAGSGKTSLLRHITRLQADRFSRGETSTLLLYLDAQGKGLSQLEDVMARALQDLRARFTYHCIAPLTRRRCVVPIVDGFDELIGPTSAREAFGNLAQFLAQLDCQGALITSSRSAFIDYRTLYERAAEIAAAQGLSYEIYPIELLPWPENIIFELAKKKLGGATDKIEHIRTLITTPAGELIRKPFFLSHMCNILKEGGVVKGDQDIVRQVVDASLDREAQKLKDKRMKSLLSQEQHRQFCQALADEMWWQERSELDIQTIRTIAEIYADENKLKPEDTKLFIDRSVAHGVLKNVQGDPEKREFEHELFRFEFQAGRLSSILLGDEVELRDFILRRELPSDLIDRVMAYRMISNAESAAIIKHLCEIARKSRNNPIAALNCGALVASILSSRKGISESGRLDSLCFRNVDFGEVKLTKWFINECIFERANLSEVQLNECGLNNNIFIVCKLGPKTRFDKCIISAQAFSGIEEIDGREIYDPISINDFLVKAGAILPEDEVIQKAVVVPEIIKQRIQVTERLLQHARTHFYLSDEDTWVQKWLIRQGEWATIEQLLRKYKLLADVVIQKAGKPIKFMRFTVFPDVIAGARTSPLKAAQNVKAFWQDISSTGS